MNRINIIIGSMCVGALLFSCRGNGKATDGDAGDTGDSHTGDTGNDTGNDTGTGLDSDDSDSGTVSETQSGCEPLARAGGNTISVTPEQAGELQSIVANAAEGDTVLFADGEYELGGAYLWISSPGVTLRSFSGDPESVVLDGEYSTTEIVTVAASDVTVAELTIRRAYTHPIHVISSDLGDTTGTLIYRVHIVDPREQAIKINPHADGFYVDNGEIACSSIRLTDDGRPQINPASGGCYTGGVDGHQARGWTVRDNTIEGFWCESGLSEHAIHMWRGGRDTVVERNILIDNARGVGFGLSADGDARVYDDDPCPGASGEYVGHYGGIVRNNFIYVSSEELLASASGYDCGVCLWSACEAKVVHNTIVSTGGGFSSVEWRFGGAADNEIMNNIATDAFRERNGASATQDGNLEDASLSLFVDGAGGDLHLSSDAAEAIDKGVPLESGVCEEDIDLQTRDSLPDIGADELVTQG